MAALPALPLLHIGSATTQTRHATAACAFADLEGHLAGQPLPSAGPECR